jgi:twitching motility protein PilT
MMCAIRGVSLPQDDRPPHYSKFLRASRQAQARAMLTNSLRGVLAQLLLKKADGSGRVAVNEILIANAAVSAIIREGATKKLQDVIVSGKSQGMQLMDDAIWALLRKEPSRRMKRS